jgi:flagellar basal body-associated protein FliL
MSPILNLNLFSSYCLILSFLFPKKKEKPGKTEKKLSDLFFVILILVLTPMMLTCVLVYMYFLYETQQSSRETHAGQFYECGNCDH